MKVYLHMGMPKSGSTAIQSFLADNDNNEILKQYGYVFPLEYCPWNKNNDISIGGYGNINRIIKAPYLSDEEKIDGLMNIVNHYSNNFNIILSLENIYRFENRFNLIRLLHERITSSGNELYVIVYLRNQYDYIVSDYLEVCKRHKNTRGIGCFVRDNYPTNVLDAYRTLRTIEGIVGYDNLLVRNYDLCKKDLINDFLSVLGLQEVQFRIDPTTVNPSIDELTGLAMTGLNDVPYVNSNVNNTYLNIIIDMEKSPTKKVIMPVSIQLWLIFRYGRGNRKISKRYWKGKEKLNRLKIHLPSLITRNNIRDRQIKILSAVLIKQNMEIRELEKKLYGVNLIQTQMWNSKNGRGFHILPTIVELEPYFESLVENKDDYIYAICVNDFNKKLISKPVVSSLQRLGIDEAMKSGNGDNTVLIALIENGKVLINEIGEKVLFKWQRIKEHEFYIESRVKEIGCIKSVILDDIMYNDGSNKGIDIVVFDNDCNVIDSVKFTMEKGSVRCKRLLFDRYIGIDVEKEKQKRHIRWS